jgi:hypothetical protein
MTFPDVKDIKTNVMVDAHTEVRVKFDTPTMGKANFELKGVLKMKMLADDRRRIISFYRKVAGSWSDCDLDDGLEPEVHSAIRQLVEAGIYELADWPDEVSKLVTVDDWR